jgi:hypothetical protein
VYWFLFQSFVLYKFQNLLEIQKLKSNNYLLVHLEVPGILEHHQQDPEHPEHLVLPGILGILEHLVLPEILDFLDFLELLVLLKDLEFLDYL